MQEFGYVDMRIRRDRRGFTLVEVFAGIMVFAFGVLALYRLQAAGIQNNSFSHHITRSTSVAHTQLERLSALDYDHNDLDGPNGDDSGIDNTVDGSGNVMAGTKEWSDGTDPDSPYRIFWNVVGDDPIADTKRIRVIVTWADAGGGVHRLALESMKCRGI
jgi:hypothetical protein